MTWRTCRLGDVLKLQRGHDLPADVRQPGDVPVVSSSGITGSHNEAKAKAPGVVTGRYGTLGEVFFIQEDYWPLNTALYVVDFKGTHPRFAAYFLRNALRDYQSDKAAVPGVDRNVLHELKVRVPDPARQGRISGVLSAYDDLIENNTRRIALLEQAARLLYEEWFVRLRFPGHEHTRLADAMPMGWKRLPLGEMLVLQRGFDLPVQDREDGNIPIYASTGVTGYHNQAKVTGPGVVTGRSGTLGVVNYVPTDFWPLNTTLWVREFKRVPPCFAVYLLRQMRLEQYNGGVAVPTLDRNIVHAVEVLLPPARLLSLFAEHVDVISAQIDTLQRYNNKVREARDLLLPRLMSGEVAV